MSDTKHTPGPWAMDPSRRTQFGDTCIVRAEHLGDKGPPRIAAVDRREDARLIAAAPELLEALKGLSKSEDGFCVCVVLRRDRHDDRCSAARAALAKAEGKEQG